MKKWLKKMWVKLVTQFGNIKVYKFPMFLVYDPSEYEMDGVHTKAAAELLQPGDILLRGYNHYLDGYFIDDPHGYSHGAVYVGDDTIVHAVAEGVSRIHALDFMKCDRICILRPKSGQAEAIRTAQKFADENVPYDFNFKNGASAVYCFELCALCYPGLSIQRMDFKKFFGLVRRNAYLADSFRENDNFTTMLEYNPKHSIDTVIV